MAKNMRINKNEEIFGIFNREYVIENQMRLATRFSMAKFFHPTNSQWSKENLKVLSDLETNFFRK